MAIVTSLSGRFMGDSSLGLSTQTTSAWSELSRSSASCFSWVITPIFSVHGRLRRINLWAVAGMSHVTAVTSRKGREK